MVTTRRGARAGVAFLAAAGMVALGACSGGSTQGDDGEVTLVFTWWGDASRAERYEEAIDLYEEQNPGVTIQSGYQAFGDYWTARNTEAAGGSLPDVMQMDVTYLSQYAGSGMIQPLDEYTAGAIDIEGFPEAVMPATKVDDEIYGIPTTTSTLASFHNADLLRRIGVEVPDGDLTWDEYDAYLADIAQAGADQDPKADGSTPYTQFLAVFEIWLQQRGKTLYTPEGEFGFDEADLTEWWERIEPMVGSGAFIEPKRGEQTEADNLSAHFTGNELSWYNFLVRFAEGSGGDEFAMTSPPADDPDSHGMYLKPSLMLSMASTTEHPEEAAAFIDFITNAPEVSKIFGMSRGVPISGSAADALRPEGLDRQILDYYEQVVDTVDAAPPPPPEGAGAVEAEFLRIGEDISYGATSVDDGVAEFFATAPDLLTTD